MAIIRKPSASAAARSAIVDLKPAGEDTMVYLDAHHIVSIEDDD